jgi:hypothetical protein
MGLIVEEWNINRDLGMRRISIKTVPQILADDQKRQLHISSDLLYNSDIFDRVITSDEMRCFQYDPETSPKHAVENTEFTSAEKGCMCCSQDLAWVFL